MRGNKSPPPPLPRSGEGMRGMPDGWLPSKSQGLEKQRKKEEGKETKMEGLSRQQESLSWLESIEKRVGAESLQVESLEWAELGFAREGMTEKVAVCGQKSTSCFNEKMSSRSRNTVLWLIYCLKHRYVWYVCTITYVRSMASHVFLITFHV